MSEEKNDNEPLHVDEEEEKEKKPKGSKPNTLALVLMIVILIGIAVFGGYYTYYQYKRMEEANSQPKK